MFETRGPSQAQPNVMLSANASSFAEVGEDYRDVPVKLLCQVEAPTPIVPGEQPPTNEMLCEEILSNFNSRSKSIRRDFRKGLGKDWLLSLSATRSLVYASPKGGGRTINVPIAAIEGCAEGTGQKFAFVAESPENNVKYVYAFQFKRKQDGPGFVDTLRQLLQQHHSNTSNRDINATPGKKGSAIPHTNLDDTPVGSSTPNVSKQADTASVEALQNTITNLQGQVKSLEEQLAVEKANVSTAEVARLSSVLRWVSAEKEAAELKNEMAEMRTEMAAVAAEMAADMAQMKQSAADEAAQQILNQLSLIKIGLEKVGNNVVNDEEKGKFWDTVQATFDKKDPTPQLNQQRSRGMMQSSRAKLLGLSRGSSAQLLGETPKRSSGRLQLNELQALEKPKLIEMVLELRSKVDRLEANNTGKELKGMIDHLQKVNQDYAREIEELKAENEFQGKAFELEKKLLADTIAGQQLETSTPMLKPPQSVLGKKPSDLLADETFDTFMGNDVTNLDQFEGSPGEFTEEITFSKAATGLGFSIAGGTNDRVEENDSSIYVTHVMEQGAAFQDGRLQVGDRIHSVNGVTVEECTHEFAVKQLQQVTDSVTLVVSRFETPYEIQEEVEDIVFAKGPGGLGFSIAGGTDHPVEDEDHFIYVTTVTEGGVADLDGRLRIGDKILSVNGSSLEEVTHEEAVKVLQKVTDVVSMQVSRIPESILEPAGALDLGPEIVESQQQQQQQAEVQMPQQQQQQQAEVQKPQQQQQNEIQPVDFLPDELMDETTRDMGDTSQVMEDIFVIEFSKEQGEGLGFSIAGGLDQYVAEGDFSIYITHVIEGGAAFRDGRLQIGDRLIEVNGTNVLSVNHKDAVSALQAEPTHIKMVVSRVPPPIEEVENIDFIKGKGGLGFSIAGGTDDMADGDPGIYVTQIIAGSSADRDGRLRLGDKITSVNGSNLDAVTHDEAVRVLQSTPVEVNLVVSRLVDAPNDAPIETFHDIAFKKGPQGLGFSVAGGVDDCIEPGDSGVYVTNISEGGAAHLDGQLRFGDKLVEVNGISLLNVNHADAVNALQSDPDGVTLLVARLVEDEEEVGMEDSEEILETIEIAKGPTGLGFSIAGGCDNPVEEGDPSIYITNVIQGGAASKDGRLQLGDKIVSINGESAANISHAQTVGFLQQNPKKVTLVVSRYAQEGIPMDGEQ